MTLRIDFSRLDLRDALDLAVLIEKEAEERYLMFADQLGERYPEDATSFFKFMAQSEKKHGEELAERRRQLFGDAPMRVDADMIQDVEAPETSKPRPFMSPRHAMNVAMESEIKAWEFFNQALPAIEDPQVRTLFTELRDEEAEHQRILKEHMAKYPDTLEPDIDPGDVDTPEL